MNGTLIYALALPMCINIQCNKDAGTGTPDNLTRDRQSGLGWNPKLASKLRRQEWVKDH